MNPSVLDLKTKASRFRHNVQYGWKVAVAADRPRETLFQTPGGQFAHFHIVPTSQTHQYLTSSLISKHKFSVFPIGIIPDIHRELGKVLSICTTLLTRFQEQT